MDERLRDAIARLKQSRSTYYAGMVKDIETVIQAATERDTLAKALEVAVKALQHYNTNGTTTAAEALSEIERIKGAR